MTFLRPACFGLLVMLSTNPAFAQAPASCAAPTMPQALALPALTKPQKPAQLPCDQNNSCKKAQIDAYNAQAKQYNDAVAALRDQHNQRTDQVNAYIGQLNAYNKDTQAYLTCEHDRSRPS